MNKPTTEIRVQDLKYGPNLTAGELADHLDFDAQIGRAHRAANNGWGSCHEDTWEKAAAKLRELERENAELRSIVNGNCPKCDGPLCCLVCDKAELSKIAVLS